VQLSGAGRLGNAAALTIRQRGVYDLNGVTPATNHNAFNTAGRVINTSETPATFTIGGSNGTGTSFGTIEGAISVVKLGTGAQSWLGLNSYTGSTTIGSTGLVTVDFMANIGEDSGIGRGDATNETTNAASLVFDGSTGGLVYAGSIRDGNLILGTQSATTDRLFTMSGSGATLSSTATNNNAIVWSNTGAVVHGTVAARTLIFTGTSLGDNTFNPQLTDSGTGANITGLSKTGTGQWNLGNANNTYTGLTSVANGVLALNHNGALPANSPLVLGDGSTAGVLQMSGTFERGLAATPASGTGTVSWSGTAGGGFAAHTDALVVAIGGVSSPTPLTWGAGGFVLHVAALRPAARLHRRGQGEVRRLGRVNAWRVRQSANDGRRSSVGQPGADSPRWRMDTVLGGLD
jgi:autotransporter-associated beta strand protein